MRLRKGLPILAWPVTNSCALRRQVVALQVRSAARAAEPERAPGDELDYAGALNRALPGDIRVLGWAPAREGFSARSARG
jgi:tRNA U38,U39,U40 pseudouridine synthase TruA